MAKLQICSANWFISMTSHSLKINVKTNPWHSVKENPFQSSLKHRFVPELCCIDPRIVYSWLIESWVLFVFPHPSYFNNWISRRREELLDVYDDVIYAVSERNLFQNKSFLFLHCAIQEFKIERFREIFGSLFWIDLAITNTDSPAELKELNISYQLWDNDLVIRTTLSPKELHDIISRLHLD